MTARDLEAPVEQYGTPLYVYRLERAAIAWRDLTEALPAPSLLHYSLEANPHPDLVRTLIRLGARTEVSSPAELDAAISGAAPGQECLYTGPAKSDQELEHALARGVRRFSVESELDYRRVSDAAASAGAQAECLIRINGYPSGATGLRMSGAMSQFGVDLESLPKRRSGFASTAHPGIAGIHLFPVSNARDEHSLREALTNSIGHARLASDTLGIETEMVDLGGGFAAPYAAPGHRPVYDGLRHALEAALDGAFPGWRLGRPHIAFESGCYLAGDCGEFICTVMDAKSSGSRRFIVLDGGINHLGGMAGLGRLLRPSASPELDGPLLAPPLLWVPYVHRQTC